MDMISTLLLIFMDFRLFVEKYYVLTSIFPLNFGYRFCMVVACTSR